MVYAAAWLWRRIHFRTRFVAITGSVGKTTSKEATAIILSRRYSVAKNRLTVNSGRGLWRTLLQVGLGRDYAVLEVGASARFSVAKAAAAILPHIAVVTAIKRNHRSDFRTLEDTAREKSLLLARLGSDGVAVLNADDPLVIAMAAPPRSRVVRFGQGESADVRFSNVRSNWPHRMSFELTCGGRTATVRTQLIGTHWAAALTAAAAVGWICGIGLDDIAGALGELEPTTARCEPVTIPSGAILIRDEYNGSIDTFEPAFELMASARAQRRVVVFSDFADTADRPRTRMKILGRAAARVADLAVFIGDRSAVAKRAAEAGDSGIRAEAFAGLEHAAEFLRGELREGDLVLLKGRTQQHLSRLYFSQFGEVSCWKPTCKKLTLCDSCDLLGTGIARRAAEFQANHAEI